MNPARIRHRISAIRIDEAMSGRKRIYVDFYDTNNRARWYLFYLPRLRAFTKGVRQDNGVAGAPLPAGLKDYLVSILPPEIIARCLAASIAYGSAP